MKNNEEFIKLKEENKNNNKLLLIIEIVLLIISTLSLVMMIIAADYTSNNILKYTLVITAVFIMTLGIIFSFIIEKETGYHECKKCHHKYKPTYKQILFSMHIGWTKYLKCPKCHLRSWSKKILSK